MVILIDKSIDSPKIHLDEQKPVFLIEGDSYPADVYKAYRIVFDWIKDYSHLIGNKLVCEFKFNILNSTSGKMVYEIISTLNKTLPGDTEIQIHWYYKNNDDDIREVGEILSDQSKLPFQFIKTF